jgi:hypothetical protein
MNKYTQGIKEVSGGIPIQQWVHQNVEDKVSDGEHPSISAYSFRDERNSVNDISKSTTIPCYHVSCFDTKTMGILNNWLKTANSPKNFVLPLFEARTHEPRFRKMLLVTYRWMGLFSNKCVELDTTELSYVIPNFTSWIKSLIMETVADGRKASLKLLCLAIEKTFANMTWYYEQKTFAVCSNQINDMAYNILSDDVMHWMIAASVFNRDKAMPSIKMLAALVVTLQRIKKRAKRKPVDLANEPGLLACWIVCPLLMVHKTDIANHLETALGKLFPLMANTKISRTQRNEQLIKFALSHSMVEYPEGFSETALARLTLEEVHERTGVFSRIGIFPEIDRKFISNSSVTYKGVRSSVVCMRGKDNIIELYPGNTDNTVWTGCCLSNGEYIILPVALKSLNTVGGYKSNGPTIRFTQDSGTQDVMPKHLAGSSNVKEFIPSERGNRRWKDVHRPLDLTESFSLNITDTKYTIKRNSGAMFFTSNKQYGRDVVMAFKCMRTIIITPSQIGGVVMEAKAKIAVEHVAVTMTPEQLLVQFRKLDMMQQVKFLAQANKKS